jgi:arabinosaccharide transport system substrate-binding protein
MEFPYGKAPLAILVLAVASGAFVLVSADREQARRPDLVLATFTKEHGAAYQPAVRAFEKRHNVSIQIQVVSQRALQSRLQSAMQAGAEVPDMVELLYGTMGFFTRGPLEDVRLLDLTERVRQAGLDKSLVTSRFGIWSSRGRLFALPHDVHPVMLAYRRDLVEQLGIDVSKLTTWDEFCRVGREVVTKDFDGDGIYDRYMLDLPADGNEQLRLLLLQRGGAVFDESGDVAFDSEAAVDVVCWYVKQLQGKDRIVYPAGWGQTFSRAIIDGLCLFYICPDWRTSQIEQDIPSLRGKLDVMPLPAWEAGGPRTSTWGGTGLAITKQCSNPELAWKLAMYLYYDRSQLGERFAATNILPPLKDAWTEPAFGEPRAFWSGRRIGQAYAQLAEQTPNEQISPYQTMATGKLSEAFTNASLYHREHGEAGLREYTRSELKRCADRARQVIGRNTFLKTASAPPVAGEGE